MVALCVSEIVRGRRLISVAPDAPVDAVSRLMTERRIGAVAVVQDGGELVGLVSEGDIVARVVARGWWPSATRADQIMTPAPRTVDIGTSVSDAHRIMHDERIRHLPVMRDGRPVSMLTGRDLWHAGRLGGAAEAEGRQVSR